jgi:hypothetical protein
VFDSCSKDFICGILTRADNWTSHPRSSGGFVVIKAEGRQLLANFVKNLTDQQRREMLQKVLKARFKRILTDEEMEKFREQLRADLRSKHCGDSAA